MGEFFVEVLKSYGLPAFLVAAVIVLCLWGIAHWAAAPGAEVSVLWGLAKYTKRVRPVKSGGEPGEILPHDPLKAIRLETPALLQVASAPAAGLWLAAEATTAEVPGILQAAAQVKPEYRAEALARSVQALAALERTDEARRLAERSCASMNDVPPVLRRHALVSMADMFLAAGLNKEALELAERALPDTRVARPPDEFQSARLTRTFIRCDSVNKGLTVARSFPDAKGRASALSAVAHLLLESGRDAEAAAIVREALTVTQTIAEPMDRARGFADRALDFARAGCYDDSMRLARQAHEAALKIDPHAIFGELAAKIIISDMQFFEAQPEQVLAQAEMQHQPRVLLKVAAALPLRSEERRRAISAALRLGREGHMPDVFAEAGELQAASGSLEEAADSGKRSADLALQSGDAHMRDAVLPRAAALLARHGDFEAALEAAAGVSSPRWAAEPMVKVLAACYAHRGQAGARAAATLDRTWSAAKRLEDRDRSASCMFLAASQAFIERLKEAAMIGREAPQTGHKLGAYAVTALVAGVQHLPAPAEARLRGTRGDALVAVLSPVFDWGIGN